MRAESELSPLEKAYLGAVEKGDYGSVKQALEVCAVSLQSLLDTLSGKKIRSEIHFHQGSRQHDNCEEKFPHSTLNSTHMLLTCYYNLAISSALEFLLLYILLLLFSA